MRKANFKWTAGEIAVLFFATALLFAASCGGNANKKQTGDSADRAAGKNVVVSAGTKPADYTAGALAKMTSLGKTEKEKRLVTVGGNSDRTLYTVRTFENGKCTDKSEYHFCRADIGKALFDAYAASATEVNEADRWVYTSYGSDIGNWQNWYDAMKKAEGRGITIIE